MPLQRKPVPLTAWHLTDPAVMVTALTSLSSSGWRGGVGYDDATGTWRLELNIDSPTRQVIAVTGDWLIDDMGLRAITDADCSANYDEVTE